MAKEKLSAGQPVVASSTATVEPAHRPEVGGDSLLHVREIVQQAAELALTIRSLAARAIDEQPLVGSDPTDLVSIRELACRLGWMVDLAASELGGIRYVGDATNWAFPGLVSAIGEHTARSSAQGVQR